MQAACIAVALELRQLKILWPQELEGHIEVSVIYPRGESRCPRCDRVIHKEQDRRGWSYLGKEQLSIKATGRTA